MLWVLDPYIFLIPVFNEGMHWHANIWIKCFFHRKLFSSNMTVLLLQSIPYYCETDPFPWQSCRQDKLGCMSPILTFSPCSESEAAGQRKGGLPVWGGCCCCPLQLLILSPCHWSRGRGGCAGWGQIHLFFLLLQDLTNQTAESVLCCLIPSAASKISTALHSGIKTKKTHKTAQIAAPIQLLPLLSWLPSFRQLQSWFC